MVLAGSPGSGKSTISRHIIEKINALYGEEVAIVVTQDGFHYYRHELEKFPNKEEAFKRRGAPFTFDSELFLKLIKVLREPINDNLIITAPDFNHKVKDPQSNAIYIKPEHKIIIIEGNYVLLKDENWKEIGSLVDERWKIHVEPKIARSRIVKRHIESGISSTIEKAIKRCDDNDMINAEYIRLNSCVPDLTIESIDE
ncbi:putative uridine kinase [Wickerhamomyces ciferrii]|uniref:Uridine kinase n=1 Tax=Wickerhamomyces ciferrii (strain ATCC 14091 / BCRC 22168 / CBS 111 / JCM 3599 / NBRC 0793 / NRRL Y-1031 F-60-10) TaxID=1206466 RepID=K0KP64_WICCF|nr:putative uridine kinase [Wickerhamomyces ciferrii]CCH47070.1 putative uridine kinase [Wickerhamomyces ciferrii]